MFKLGEYCEEDLKPLIGYLNDAGFRVDVRPSLGAWTDTTAFLEGRFDELKDLVEDPERYEGYLEALKSAVVCRIFCNLVGPVYPILQVNPHP